MIALINADAWVGASTINRFGRCGAAKISNSVPDTRIPTSRDTVRGSIWSFKIVAPAAYDFGPN